MPATRFPRLEDVLGAPIAALTEQHLADCVARAGGPQPVREDWDLDFKEALYASAEDLGADVAAMANTRGGVLLVGVGEADGVASRLTPVVIGDEEARRMRQMLADTVFPRVEYEIHRVASTADPQQGYFALAISRSALAPHAVRHRKSLRYYRRDGPRNRPLEESEVADLYRSRFELARGQLERLEEVHEAGYGRHHSVNTWMTMALAPSSPGKLSIRAGTLTEARRWLEGYSGGFLAQGPFSEMPLDVTTGLRCLVVAGGWHDGLPLSSYAELHTDGAGFVAIPLHSPSEAVWQLYDEHIVLAVFGMLRLLSDHAANLGSAGDAVVLATVAGGREYGTPYRLGQVRTQGRWLQLSGSRELKLLPPSRHTMDLHSIVANHRDCAVAVRLIASDWFHAFGRPELLQISDTGAIRPSYWVRSNLQAWRQRFSLVEDSSEVPPG